MKKIFTLIMVACLSLMVFAQASQTITPKSLKTFMAKEHLSHTLQSLQQPARQDAQRMAEKQTQEWTAYTATTKAPAELNGLDTTEVHFTSFYDDPIYYEAGDWYIVLTNDRYQFIFDFYTNNPNSPAGTYTEKDLDAWFSWCMFPEANGKTHYYKTCELKIQEEKLSDNLIKYTLDAVMLVTKGLEEGSPEYGYFKVHGEHKVIKAKSHYDVAILNCEVTPADDHFRIVGKNDTMDVDLTFFTETGVEGYYSHKLMDEEASTFIHRGKEHGIMELEGIITAAQTQTGGVAYVFMFEAFTTDTCFFNVAMEAPVIPTDSIEITAHNAILDDSYGMSEQTITIKASTSEYDIYAAYNDTRIITPAVYGPDRSYLYLTDLKTGEIITPMQSTIEVTGNVFQGYNVEITMLGYDHKYYEMHLSYSIPTAKETKVLNFTENSKTMYYIDVLGLQELQIANFDGEYSVSFDILNIDIVMGGAFEKADLWEEQTFLIHHVNDNGDVYDAPVQFATIGGEIYQKNDTTYLTASILGFDSIQYEISMFYTVPTPTKTVTYTFDGLNNEEAVEFTNAISSGIFILNAMSDDGDLMAKVNVERIENNSVEGTFYNDGNFGHNDFYVTDTYVQEWNSATREYDTYTVQKGTMTVTVENGILTAVASFICDNAVQYDLTFITTYARERIIFDTEEGEMDYTFPANAEVYITDFIDGYGIIQLIIADAYYAVDFYFNADAMDPTIGVPAGEYPINPSFDSGTVLACKGVLPDGPAQSYFCGLDADGYLDPMQLYCLVDGTVIVENVGGKLKVEVDAVNSYDVPVTLHYEAAHGADVENVTDNQDVNTCKVLKQGQLLIIRNGKTYNANGALVK